jgi:NAD(P)-dependent dehydrogenase (short-subunit alcohol dehydrogenase family)
VILKDKVSLITGGSRGIGKAIAVAFAKEGSHLVLTSRTEVEQAATKREIENLSSARVEIFPADVSKPKEVQHLVVFTLAKFATIDILVNCAGIYGPIGLVPDIDSEKWIEAINMNLYGTFLCMKAVLPIMIKNRRGKIINFSGGGAVSPRPRFSAYSASKAAVVRLTETLAEEVREYNIDINAVAPGAVNTRLLDEVLEAGEAAGKAELAKSIKQKQEGGTPPDKVAELAVFLASAASDGLSGRLISLLWDNWREIPQHLDSIMSSDIYTMRRIIPKERGYNW